MIQALLCVLVGASVVQTSAACSCYFFRDFCSKLAEGTRVIPLKEIEQDRDFMHIQYDGLITDASGGNPRHVTIITAEQDSLCGVSLAPHDIWFTLSKLDTTTNSINLNMCNSRKQEILLVTCTKPNHRKIFENKSVPQSI